MKQITDELREYAGSFHLFHNGVQETLDAIADRIDAEHERAVMSAMNDALYHANDESMAELGWVRLPKDADGEPIHLGDEVYCVDDPEHHNPARFMTLYEGGWAVDSCMPSKLRHCEPTVEDVLRELIHRYDELRRGPSAFDPFELLTEYAAKLRLAGDAE